jgi:anaerobic magnesium-protoporphyrin IX monomethyl ester cyclase
MKILLINPLLTKRKPVLHNIGLSYIGAVLIKAGYNVTLLDIEGYKYSENEVLDRIKKINPDVICTGTIITGFNYVQRLCSEIKKLLPSVPIILGNSIATTIPKIAAQNLNVDYLVIGEGETTILELLKTLSNNDGVSKVKGICYKNGDEIILTESRELIQDIDTIPLPAWHLFPLKEVYLKNRSYSLPLPIGNISSNRGCPYICTFCYHPFQNKKVRMHSPERVVEEIKILKKDYGIKGLAFVDDLFVINKKRVYLICDLMDKEGIKIKWRASCRVNLIDEELLVRMKKSGCVQLGIGVESASQTILDNIKKNVTVENILKAFEICKRHNVSILSSYMIGNVGETRETVFETVNFRKKHDPGPGGFFFATPYPDTELYNYAMENDLIKNELELIQSYGEQSDSIKINFTKMSDAELIKLKKDANKELTVDYIKKFPVQGGIFAAKFLMKKLLHSFN